MDFQRPSFIDCEHIACSSEQVWGLQDRTEDQRLLVERDRANVALVQSEARLAKIFDQALVGIMECGPDGRTRLINTRFCEILGRTFDELQRCSVSDYTHPEDLPWNLPLLDAKKREGAPFQIEKRYLRPDGSIVWCNVSISFMLGATGEVEGTIVVAEDISARKNAEAELKASELLHRSILEASADCIMVVGLDRGLELVNEPGLGALEIQDFEKFRGFNWVELWPPESRATVCAAISEASAGKSARFSAYSPTARGTPKWWDVVVSPILDETGNVKKLCNPPACPALSGR